MIIVITKEYLISLLKLHMETVELRKEANSLIMCDATKRPIQVPIRYVPYLEKHQIYRLFHYLASQLVIKKPQDAVIFLKQLLEAEGRSWDKLRIILLGPPYIDKIYIAKYLSERTQAKVITYEDMSIKKSNTIKEAVSKILCSQPILNTGWILTDFPRTAEEGLAIKEANIFPTHVLHLRAPEPEEDLSLCIDMTEKKKLYAEYKQNIRSLKRIFQHIIKECKVEDRSTEQLSAHCMKLIQVLRHDGEAMLPRVAIIGPRGSGKKTHAKLLRQRFGLVSIDWEFLVEETLKREDKLGDSVRNAKENRVDIFPNLAMKILEDHLLQWDCQRYGWVLTGFHDAKILNSLVTSPNRIILFEINAVMCMRRLTSKHLNKYSGARYDDSNTPQQAIIYPRDHLNPIYNEVQIFLNDMDRIREACGDKVIIVDASQSIRNVYEMVCAAIMRPLPPAMTVYKNTSI